MGIDESFFASLAQPGIRALRAYDPGHDLVALRRRCDSLLIELGSNENPYGASPATRAAMLDVMHELHRYPDPLGGDLKRALEAPTRQIAENSGTDGSIIVAADDGVVDAAGWVQVGGRRVCVQHAEGFESCYYHTSAALVSIGEHVARGQPIALIGMTGATTGPHVHWEVKENGRIVDPLAH